MEVIIIFILGVILMAIGWLSMMLSVCLKNQGFIVEKLNEITKKLNNHGKD